MSARIRRGGLLRRALVWALSGVLVASVAWSVLSRSGRPPAGPAHELVAPPAAPAVEPQAPSPAASPPASQGGQAGLSGRLQGGTLVETAPSGRTRWRITAQDVILQHAGRTVVLHQVNATFYGDDGTTMTVTGEMGRYDTRTRQVSLTGHVHGVSSRGRELFADRLDYLPGSATLRGSGHVRVVEGRVVMDADQMESNVTLGETRFSGHVHMTLR